MLCAGVAGAQAEGGGRLAVTARVRPLSAR